MKTASHRDHYIVTNVSAIVYRNIVFTLQLGPFHLRTDRDNNSNYRVHSECIYELRGGVYYRCIYIDVSILNRPYYALLFLATVARCRSSPVRLTSYLLYRVRCTRHVRLWIYHIVTMPIRLLLRSILIVRNRE